MDWILNFFSASWIAPLLTFLVGWLALPTPGTIADSWWGKLIASIFGNTISVANIEQIIAIIMAILQKSGAVPPGTLTPDAKQVSRVLRKKISVDDAANNHKAVINSLQKNVDFLAKK